MNKRLQIAVEKWYTNHKPFDMYFDMDGERYIVYNRYDAKFDVFKVRAYTIGDTVYEYPNYDPETHNPINRVAVITIPNEIAEAKQNCDLFENFFK